MESIFVKFAQYPSIETWSVYCLDLSLYDAEAMFDYASDTRVIHVTLFQPIKVEETKNNIAQFYLANPLGRCGGLN